MAATYSNGTWHYNDGSHYPDLHHAFIFRSIGGGIAYLNAVCSSWIGYGVSSGMVGSLAQIQTGDMYWVREEPFSFLSVHGPTVVSLFALNLCFHFIPIQY